MNKLLKLTLLLSVPFSLTTALHAMQENKEIVEIKENKKFSEKEQKELDERLKDALINNDLNEVKQACQDGAGLGSLNLIFPLYFLECSEGIQKYICELWIEKGIAMESTGFTGVIHLVSLGGFTDLIKLALDKGADVNARDKHGDTPLHLAVKGFGVKGLGLIRFLIESGADSTIKNFNNETAQDIARLSNAPLQILRFLPVVGYFDLLSQDCKRFVKSPLNFGSQIKTVANSNVSLPNKIFLKMCYRDKKYFVTLSQVYKVFQDKNKNEQLAKLIKKCKFTQCSKEGLKRLRTTGFSLTKNEFETKEQLHQLCLKKWKTDLCFED